MASRDKYTPKNQAENETVPFNSAEEALFWFVAAQCARNEGAKFMTGQALLPRPCEPMDFMHVLDRLYRNRMLLRDHLRILSHYGKRHMAPDPRRLKEHRAYELWTEALQRIELVLIRKGIVRRKDGWAMGGHWLQNAFIPETVEA